MQLVEPSSVICETGRVVEFFSEDGSGPVVVRGLLENQTEERDTGATRRQTEAWHFTAPSASLADFAEGDYFIIPEDPAIRSQTLTLSGVPITLGVSRFTILDRVVDDGEIVTLLLSSN
jgi:hypothetical protein